jgi:hypothetical protein
MCRAKEKRMEYLFSQTKCLPLLQTLPRTEVEFGSEEKMKTLNHIWWWRSQAKNCE